jgi:hypothetical protein
MAKVSAKGAVITLNSQNHSTYCRSYEIEWAQDMPEVTGFTDGWRNYLGGGMPVIGFTLDMMYEGTASTGPYAILKAMMSTPATCSIVPESGGPSFSGSFYCDGIHPKGTASAGVIDLGSVHFSAAGTSIATYAS